MLAKPTSLRQSLARTRGAVFGRLASLLGQNEIGAGIWDELEATLIQADMGAALAQAVVSALQRRVRDEGLIRAEALRAALRAELRARLGEAKPLALHSAPTVILLTGVNGSGKTTTAAKLAHYFKSRNKTVMLGAADTFRAAAVDQLQVWGERLGIPVVAGQPNADPGAVAHDALAAAVARKVDLLLVDTAGRLQTKYNLMEEIKKVRGVIAKALPGAPHESLLVLDATTGQNALAQARAFKDAVALTGVIISKLDGSAKGGMAFAIRRELDLPIRWIGTGEQLEDLEEFDPELFVAGLLD